VLRQVAEGRFPLRALQLAGGMVMLRDLPLVPGAAQEVVVPSQGGVVVVLPVPLRVPASVRF